MKNQALVTFASVILVVLVIVTGVILWLNRTESQKSEKENKNIQMQDKPLILRQPQKENKKIKGKDKRLILKQGYMKFSHGSSSSTGENFNKIFNLELEKPEVYQSSKSKLNTLNILPFYTLHHLRDNLTQYHCSIEEVKIDLLPFIKDECVKLVVSPTDIIDGVIFMKDDSEVKPIKCTKEEYDLFGYKSEKKILFIIFSPTIS